ncbi:MAG: hypothetical protein U0174_04380 [Polyangiaceae bacterium]
MSPHSQSYAEAPLPHRNCIAPASALGIDENDDEAIWSTVAHNEELDLGWGDDAYSRATTPVPPHKRGEAEGPHTLPGPKLDALVEEEKKIARNR